MNKENINLAILFIIVVMTCVLIKRYNKIDKIEHFTTTTQPVTTLPPAESTYNLQQYIESNPPTGSKVIRREISHTLPDVIDKDIVMRDNTQVRFGSMRGEAGSANDSWHIQGISHPSNPSLQMVLGDAESKKSAFQIYGGACEVDGNCSESGNKLFNFDDEPTLKMYDRGGQTLLHANKHGDLTCKRNLTVQNDAIVKNLRTNEGIRATANSRFDAQLDVHGKLTAKDTLQVDGSTDLKDTFVRGGLQVLNGNIHGTGPNNILNGNLEVRRDIHGKRNAKIDGIMHAGTINGNDLNTRRRLYFSEAGKPGRAWDEQIYSAGNFNDAHKTDVVYIEKRVENEPAKGGITEGKLTTLVIKLSDDRADGLEVIGGPGGNNKLMRLDGAGNLYIKGNLHVSEGSHSNHGISHGYRHAPHWGDLTKYITKHTPGH
jgi:hypothetical protein